MNFGFVQECSIFFSFECNDFFSNMYIESPHVISSSLFVWARIHRTIRQYLQWLIDHINLHLTVRFCIFLFHLVNSYLCQEVSQFQLHTVVNCVPIENVSRNSITYTVVMT